MGLTSIKDQSKDNSKDGSKDGGETFQFQIEERQPLPEPIDNSQMAIDGKTLAPFTPYDLYPARIFSF